MCGWSDNGAERCVCVGVCVCVQLAMGNDLSSPIQSDPISYHIMFLGKRTEYEDRERETKVIFNARIQELGQVIVSKACKRSSIDDDIDGR